MADDDRRDEKMPPLGPTQRDRAVSAVRALSGAVPYIGSILSEVIGQLIPEQRLARLEEYVTKLCERLSSIERGELTDKLKDPIKIDLFEEGAFQTARSLSPERRDYIASIVARGISGGEKEEIEAKRLLNLLRELADDQVIILASYLGKNRTNVFRDRHEAVLTPEAAHMQSSRDDLDRSILYETARQQLIRLGLLRPRFKKLKKGDLPEFDEKTGMMKAQGADITPLGRLLLRCAGLANEEDV